MDSVSTLERQVSIKSIDVKNTRQNLRDIEHTVKKEENYEICRTVSSQPCFPKRNFAGTV